MPFAVSQRSKPSTLTTMDSTTITARLVAMSSRTRFMAIYSPLRRSGWGGLYGLQDGPRGILGNDIRGRVGIPRGDARKDGRLGDAQPLDAIHSQLVVHHCHRIAAHLAGADRMKNGVAQFSCRSGERFFGLDSA